MTDIKRHVGTNHLGHKVIVVFREIPDDPDHCLVVESQTLPDMYHDNLMSVVDSLEAQQTINLYEVLNRRMFGDGQQMLQTLHQRGLLRKMKVDQVTLLPMPNRQLPLREANKAIAGNDTAAPEPVETVATPQAEPVTPKGGDSQPAGVSDDKAIAASLLEQARLLEADAVKKREEAYKLDPALKKGGRPPSKKKVAAKKG